MRLYRQQYAHAGCIIAAVALFNAVRVQQKGESDRNTAAVAKKAGFLDMLSSKAKVRWLETVLCVTADHVLMTRQAWM